MATKLLSCGPEPRVNGRYADREEGCDFASGHLLELHEDVDVAQLVVDELEQLVQRSCRILPCEVARMPTAGRGDRALLGGEGLLATSVSGHGAPLVFADPHCDREQPAADRSASFELVQAPGRDDEYIVDGIIDRRAGYAEATQAAPHEPVLFAIRLREIGVDAVFAA